MTDDRPVRFAGEYHGVCPGCDAHAAFAFGFSDEHEPRAITWEGPRCVEIAIRDVRLIRQVDDDLWISLHYACGACGRWHLIQTECRAEPAPAASPAPE